MWKIFENYKFCITVCLLAPVWIFIYVYYISLHLIAQLDIVFF